VSENNTFSRRRGDDFTLLVTIRSNAPADRARNISTILGSNVRGEARNITSFDLTDRTDLENKVKFIQHIIGCGSIFNFSIGAGGVLQIDLNYILLQTVIF
jgi:hypothetical protein